MTSDLTSFAARLRGFIATWIASAPSGISINPPPSETESSWNLPMAAATDRDFNRLALELFSMQFSHNAAYRRSCEARSATPASVEHWSRIPVVPAAAFKELELTCIPPDERTRVFHSSGTTAQQPSRHFHCSESLALYEASLWPGFARHVLHDVAPERVRLVILTPPPESAPNSSLVHMFETVRQRIAPKESSFVGEVTPDGAWTLSCSRAREVLQRAADIGHPVVLLGTAFNFVHLLDGLASTKLRLRLPAGSRLMETGGYKGRSRELARHDLHAHLEQWLGVPPSNIVCEYGMSELSSQAYAGIAGTLPAPRRFHFPPWCRIQIISPETGREAREGETGLLRIFDLANAFSVLAVQTEDLAIRLGNGFELIGRAVAAEPRGCSLMAT